MFYQTYCTPHTIWDCQLSALLVLSPKIGVLVSVSWLCSNILDLSAAVKQRQILAFFVFAFLSVMVEKSNSIVLICIMEN